MGWAASVGISCDRERAIPLGVQLEWGLRSAIERGALAPDERLPPLRELADEVGAHLNTIRAVYARLEADGLIDTRHGKGSFVRSRPGASAPGYGEAVRSAARSARDAGMTPQQLAAALYVTGGDEPAASADERRKLRDQIAALEAMLAGLYGQWPDLPPQPEPPRAAGPRVLTTDELVRQRDALLERIVEVRRILAHADAPVAQPAARPAEQPEAEKAPRARRTVRPGIAPA